MKIARFVTRERGERYGIVRGDRVALIEGDPLSDFRETSDSVALGDVKLLAPIAPRNVLCIGRNYKAHAEETGSDVPAAPALFLKATSAVIGPGDAIVLPEMAPHQVDYEAELAVIIGRPARNVSQADALDCVLGYTCANDVSARDCQHGDVQWARGKSFDTFCPLGPWLETDLDPADVTVAGRLNGRTMQDAPTSLMVFSVRYLISYLSRCMTLLPGTVLLTGTPAGVGMGRTPPIWLKPGDAFEVQIGPIGTLRNPVVRGA